MRKNSSPTSEKTLTKLTITAPLNAGARNSCMSSMGFDWPSSRRTKSTPAVMPTRVSTTGSTPNPSVATSLIA